MTITHNSAARLMSKLRNEIKHRTQRYNPATQSRQT